MTKVRTSAIIKKMAVAAKTNSHRVHVTTRGTASWAIKKEGNIKASHTYSTLEEAINAAKALVDKGQASKIIVHNKQGKIVQVGV